MAAGPTHQLLSHPALLSPFPCQYLLTPEFVREVKGHVQLPELDVLVEYTVCSQLPDTESDSLSSLLQVRDAIMAVGIAGVGLAAMGLIGVMFSRNKKQNQ